jgi:hypothetical protein
MGMRFSRGSVSGSEIAIQVAIDAPAIPSTTKIHRHGATKRTSWPTAGAITGTAMKTMNARLITRAICRPT